MANYITTLQNENKERAAQIAAGLQELADFRAHLQSAKFTGSDEDGERRDWIATADVLRRLELIAQALTE